MFHNIAIVSCAYVCHKLQALRYSRLCVDIANLGSAGIKGEDVVVMGGGVRVPTTWGISFAVMYEGVVSSRKDIHDGRFTFMATWEL